MSGAKALGDFLKIFPAILKFLKFAFITAPKFIARTLKTGAKFVKKSIPLLFAIIIMYFFIFLGIQIFLKHVTDTPDLIPHIPLMLFTAYIIYQMVMTNAGVLRTLQNYIFRAFLFLFGNPLVRGRAKWPFKGTENPTIKNIAKLSKWIVFNPLHVMFVLSVYFVIIKFVLLKFKTEIFMFGKTTLINILKLLGLNQLIDLGDMSIGEYFANNPLVLLFVLFLLFITKQLFFKANNTIEETPTKKVKSKKSKKSRKSRKSRKSSKKSKSSKSSKSSNSSKSSKSVKVSKLFSKKK